MQLLLALVGIHVAGEQPLPRFAQLANPGLVLGAELLLELDAKALGQGRTVPAGRDRDLQIAAIDDRRVVEIAVVRIVDGIDEHRADTRRFVDRARDVSGNGGDDERDAVQILRSELASLPGDRACFGKLLDPGVATGATTVTDAPADRSPPILASPTGPAPTRRTGRPSSLTKIGNRAS